MNLHEAFAEIAIPDHPDPSVVARRLAAMQTVYAELNRLQRNLKRDWFEDQDREDVASRVFEALVMSGPRIREGFDDERVRAYLIRSLRNGFKSLRRSPSRRTVPSESLEHASAGGESVEERVDRETAGRILEDARRRLIGEVMPAVAGNIRRGSNFLESFRQLEDIESGTVSLNELISREFGDDLDGADAKRARNAFDQRFKRVFERLHGAVEEFAHSPEEAEALRIAIDSYRLRQ